MESMAANIPNPVRSKSLIFGFVNKKSDALRRIFNITILIGHTRKFND